MSQKDLLNHLKASFGNSVRLPSSIGFLPKPKGVLNIHINNPDCNMQSDRNAFEGWALASRVAGFEHIRLSWATESIKEPKHYNRFLYRAFMFSKYFKWFSSDVLNVDHIVGVGVEKYINHGTVSASVKDDPRSESAYEDCLYRSQVFRVEYNIDEGRIARQLPVGVYTENPPTEKSALFTGNASAIDLIGLDRDGVLKLFELKVAGNKKVGALSELFFYSCILNDIRSGFIKPSSDALIRDSLLSWQDVINSKRIENYIISSGELHPIVRGVCASSVLENFPVTCIEGYKCE